jgi:hypothetical protein
VRESEREQENPYRPSIRDHATAEACARKKYTERREDDHKGRPDASWMIDIAAQAPAAPDRQTEKDPVETMTMKSRPASGERTAIAHVLSKSQESTLEERRQ